MQRILARRPPVVFGLAVLLSATFTAEAGRAQSATLQADWLKILQAAKKEGQVVVYGAPGEELLYRQFENKHPGIKVVFISGGGERPRQIITERRAGKYLADVYIGGVGPLYTGLYKSGILDPIKEVLMLPEVVDESKWRGGRHVYLDDEKKYILAFNEVVQHYFHYNTTSVDPSQFASYWNLLDRKWKGKILAWDPLDAGAEGVVRFLYYNPDIGPEFLRRFFTEMELTVTRDVRQFVDWLAAGRFLIAGLQGSDRSGLGRAKEQGLPVDWLDSRKFKEGAPLSPGAGLIAQLNKAAHPNSAKIFINWLLSREGQITYQTIKRQTGGVRNSLRTDIPKEDVPSYARPVDGVKYLNLADREFSNASPVLKLIKNLRESH